MSPTLKVVLALVFTAALGWVLLRPVLEAVDQDPLAARDAPSPSREATAAPDPSPKPTETEQEAAGLPDDLRTESLVSAYPTRCLRPTRPEADVIAVDRGAAIAAGPLGGPLTELPGDTLLGVGVDGRVAGRGGNEAFIGAPGGEPVRGLPDVRLVVWSPASRCGVAVSKGGALLALPSEQPLLESNVLSAAFSPNGRKLALVRKDEQATSVWVVALRGVEMREVSRETPDIRLELRGWDPRGKVLYFRTAGAGLSFVTIGAPPRTGRLSSEPVDELDQPLEQCNGRVLGLVRNQIAQITVRGPEMLTQGGEGYRYISCSSDGRFIAAIGSRGLVLLDGNGGFLRDLTEDSGYTDVFVDWGEAGAGLVFGRVGSDPVAAELWYLPEGGSARPTGITYRGGPRAVDWAASPPTGLP